MDMSFGDNCDSQEDLLTQLSARIEEAGSQEAFARLHKFSGAYLSDVLRGKRPDSARLATALGFERVTAFVVKGYRDAA